MSTRRIGIAIAGLALLVGGLAVMAADDKNVWVTEDNEVIHIAGAGHMMINADDAETFDVSELVDGESRTFGEGERQITVTRSGDEVTISHPGDSGANSVVCQLSTDSCQILSVDGDDQQHMIMIRKTAECEGGEGDCLDIMTQIGAVTGGEHNVMVMTVDCDDDEDCVHSIHPDVDGHFGHHAVVEIHEGGDTMVDVMKHVIVAGDGEGAGQFVYITGGDELTLRCPEGDATITVDKDEADETFLCPKHSVPLEKATPKGGARTIQIKKVGVKEAD